MKRSWIIISALLALPVVVLGGFVLTLDPLARKDLFGEFTQHLLGKEPPPIVSPTFNQQPGADELTPVGEVPEEINVPGDEDPPEPSTGPDSASNTPEEAGAETQTDEFDDSGDAAADDEVTRGADPEPAAAATQDRPAPATDPLSRFDQQDADGDGTLAGDELSARMVQIIDQFDSDQDGAISREEFVSWLEKRRAGK